MVNQFRRNDMSKLTMQDVVYFYRGVMNKNPVNPDFHGEAFERMQWFKPLMEGGLKAEEAEQAAAKERRFITKRGYAPIPTVVTT